MGGLLLGIDIGTSSSKALLAEADGTVVATATREHDLSLPRPGWAEHDAERVWWADVVALSSELLQRTHARLAAVSVSGIGPCVLPTDASYRPLRSAILYGIDSRADREISELTERFGADAIQERGGSILTSQAAGPKLYWLRRHEPETWGGTERFLTASSYVVAQLTGEYVLDHHSASQCTPLYDLHRGCWLEEWAGEIVPGLQLPRLLWPTEIAGQVTAAAAEATGIPAGTPVSAGTIDAWAEAVSSGVENPGDCMLMYGTTMFLIRVLEESVTDRRLWATRGVAPGSMTLAGGMAASGAITDWLRQFVREAGFDRLIAEATDIVPGADALVMLPYFAGERTPIFDPAARGAVLGLTLRHTRGHLYRAALEATGYAIRHHIEVLEEIGAAPNRLVAVGGGTRGDLWPQIVSDITGRSQEIPEYTIGACYGNALIGARAASLANDGDTWARVRKVVHPQSNRSQIYKNLYEVYRQLYTSTRELAHTLTEIQQETEST